MQDRPKHHQQGRTLIGTFTENWDAEGAIEELKFAGFDGRIRHVQHEDQGIADDSRDQGGFQNYFARIYGFEDHEEYQDSRGNFSVNPEAEEYFSEAFAKKHHVVLVQAEDDIDKAIDIIRLHHGDIEVRPWAFFTAMAQDEHKTEGENFLQPPRLHPTRAIETPKDSTL